MLCQAIYTLSVRAFSLFTLYPPGFHATCGLIVVNYSQTLTRKICIQMSSCRKIPLSPTPPPSHRKGSATVLIPLLLRILLSLQTRYFRRFQIYFAFWASLHDRYYGFFLHSHPIIGSLFLHNLCGPQILVLYHHCFDHSIDRRTQNRATTPSTSTVSTVEHMQPTEEIGATG